MRNTCSRRSTQKSPAKRPDYEARNLPPNGGPPCPLRNVVSVYLAGDILAALEQQLLMTGRFRLTFFLYGFYLVLGMGIPR